MMRLFTWRSVAKSFSLAAVLVLGGVGVVVQQSWFLALGVVPLAGIGAYCATLVSAFWSTAGFDPERRVVRVPAGRLSRRLDSWALPEHAVLAVRGSAYGGGYTIWNDASPESHAVAILNGFVALSDATRFVSNLNAAAQKPGGASS